MGHVDLVNLGREGVVDLRRLFRDQLNIPASSVTGGRYLSTVRLEANVRELRKLGEARRDDGAQVERRRLVVS